MATEQTMVNAVPRFFPILLIVALFGCSDGGPAPEPGGGPDAAPDASAAADSAVPRGGSAAAFPRKPSPPGASVYFIAPSDGAVVSNPVRVVFGLAGMGVSPAGVASETAGHHHLLINADPPAFDAPIPADDRHVHFGLGQTEAELTLPPGEHRLQLLLGDELHIPHDPPVISEPVTIQVQ
jgi:hypothetical protein